MNKLIGSIGFAVSLCLAASVHAVPLIDFGTGAAGSGGTIQVTGGNVTGTNIFIDTLLVTGTGAGDGVYDVSGFLKGGTVGDLDFNTATNTITITGGVPALGIPNGTVLLSGSFSSFLFTTAGPLGSFQGEGADLKSPLLLTALGLSPTMPFQFFGFSIGMTTRRPGQFTAFSTDIANTGTAVPEPASLFLLGTGLVALSGLSRKKKALVA